MKRNGNLQAKAPGFDQQLITGLCRWFNRHARDLPWRRRKNRTGYRALVAEVMLQQTQVNRVVERYQEFLTRFPTVSSLAAADEQDVLALWQGLGYYRRARQLHQAAKFVCTEMGGRMPREVNGLMRLPGVGRYTAGAIASMVHGHAAPIVDGNVHRVLTRLFGRTRTDPAMKWTWSMAERLVDQTTDPGTFNEALMELGAVICTPRAAKCTACPIRQCCEANRRGLQDRLPVMKRRAAVKFVHHHAVVMTHNGKILMEQRSPEGLWARMWQTPTVESDRTLTEIEIQQILPAAPCVLSRVGGFDHHLSHRRIRFHVFTGQGVKCHGEWRTASDMATMPMSNAHRRVLRIALTEINQADAGFTACTRDSSA